MKHFAALAGFLIGWWAMAPAYADECEQISELEYADLDNGEEIRECLLDMQYNSIDTRVFKLSRRDRKGEEEISQADEWSACYLVHSNEQDGNDSYCSIQREGRRIYLVSSFATCHAECVRIGLER